MVLAFAGLTEVLLVLNLLILVFLEPVHVAVGMLVLGIQIHVTMGHANVANRIPALGNIMYVIMGNVSVDWIQMVPH